MILYVYDEQKNGFQGYDIRQTNIKSVVPGLNSEEQILMDRNGKVFLLTPQIMQPLNFGNQRVKSLAISSKACYAVTFYGNLYAWGQDLEQRGILGAGEIRSAVSPIKVEFQEECQIKSVACCDTFCVALDQSGRLYTWGTGPNDVDKKTLDNPVRIKQPQELQKSMTVVACSRQLIATANSMGEIFLYSNIPLPGCSNTWFGGGFFQKVANYEFEISVFTQIVVSSNTYFALNTRNQLYAIKAGQQEFQLSRIHIPKKIVKITQNNNYLFAITDDNKFLQFDRYDLYNNTQAEVTRSMRVLNNLPHDNDVQLIYSKGPNDTIAFQSSKSFDLSQAYRPTHYPNSPILSQIDNKSTIAGYESAQIRMNIVQTQTGLYRSPIKSSMSLSRMTPHSQKQKQKQPILKGYFYNATNSPSKRSSTIFNNYQTPIKQTFMSKSVGLKDTFLGSTQTPVGSQGLLMRTQQQSYLSKNVSPFSSRITLSEETPLRKSFLGGPSPDLHRSRKEQVASIVSTFKREIYSPRMSGHTRPKKPRMNSLRSHSANVELIQQVLGDFGRRSKSQNNPMVQAIMNKVSEYDQQLQNEVQEIKRQISGLEQDESSQSSGNHQAKKIDFDDLMMTSLSDLQKKKEDSLYLKAKLNQKERKNPVQQIEQIDNIESRQFSPIMINDEHQKLVASKPIFVAGKVHNTASRMIIKNFESLRKDILDEVLKELKEIRNYHNLIKQQRQIEELKQKQQAEEQIKKDILQSMQNREEELKQIQLQQIEQQMRKEQMEKIETEMRQKHQKQIEEQILKEQEAWAQLQNIKQFQQGSIQIPEEFKDFIEDGLPVVEGGVVRLKLKPKLNQSFSNIYATTTVFDQFGREIQISYPMKEIEQVPKFLSLVQETDREHQQTGNFDEIEVIDSDDKPIKAKQAQKDVPSQLRNKKGLEVGQIEVVDGQRVIRMICTEESKGEFTELLGNYQMRTEGGELVEVIEPITKKSLQCIEKLAGMKQVPKGLFVGKTLQRNVQEKNGKKIIDLKIENKSEEGEYSYRSMEIIGDDGIAYIIHYQVVKNQEGEQELSQNSQLGQQKTNELPLLVESQSQKLEGSPEQQLGQAARQRKSGKSESMQFNNSEQSGVSVRSARFERQPRSQKSLKSLDVSNEFGTNSDGVSMSEDSIKNHGAEPETGADNQDISVSKSFEIPPQNGLETVQKKIVDGKIMIKLVADAEHKDKYTDQVELISIIDEKGRQIQIERPVLRVQQIEKQSAKFEIPDAILPNKGLRLSTIEQKDGGNTVYLKPKTGTEAMYRGYKEYAVITEDGQLVKIMEPLLIDAQLSGIPLLDGVKVPVNLSDLKQEGPIRIVDGKMYIKLVPQTNRSYLFNDEYETVETLDNEGRCLVLHVPKKSIVPEPVELPRSLSNQLRSTSPIPGETSQFGGSSNESIQNIVNILNNKLIDVAKLEESNGRKVITMKPKTSQVEQFTGKWKEYNIQTEEGEVITVKEPVLDKENNLDGVKLPQGLNLQELAQQGPIQIKDGKLFMSLTPQPAKGHLYTQQMKEIEVLDNQGRKVVIRYPVRVPLNQTTSEELEFSETQIKNELISQDLLLTPSGSNSGDKRRIVQEAQRGALKTIVVFITQVILRNAFKCIHNQQYIDKITIRRPSQKSEISETDKVLLKHLEKSYESRSLKPAASSESLPNVGFPLNDRPKRSMALSQAQPQSQDNMFTSPDMKPSFSTGIQKTVDLRDSTKSISQKGSSPDRNDKKKRDEILPDTDQIQFDQNAIEEDQQLAELADPKELETPLQTAKQKNAKEGGNSSEEKSLSSLEMNTDQKVKKSPQGSEEEQTQKKPPIVYTPLPKTNINQYVISIPPVTQFGQSTKPKQQSVQPKPSQAQNQISQPFSYAQKRQQQISSANNRPSPQPSFGSLASSISFKNKRVSESGNITPNPLANSQISKYIQQQTVRISSNYSPPDFQKSPTASNYSDRFSKPSSLSNSYMSQLKSPQLQTQQLPKKDTKAPAKLAEDQKKKIAQNFKKMTTTTPSQSYKPKK